MMRTVSFNRLCVTLTQFIMGNHKVIKLIRSSERQCGICIGGATLEETAQQSFLTESGVKYRIKRILQECGIANRAELIRLLKCYLTP